MTEVTSIVLLLIALGFLGVKAIINIIGCLVRGIFYLFIFFILIIIIMYYHSEIIILIHNLKTNISWILCN
jgi:hypothetical protein